jgi:hypothetical protein
VIKADLKMEQSGHFTAEPFEARPQEFGRLASILLGISRHIPHDDMLDH